MDIHREIIDTGDSRSGVSEKRMKTENLPFEYNLHYYGYRYARSPNLTITQYIRVTDLPMYPLNQ